MTRRSLRSFLFDDFDEARVAVILCAAGLTTIAAGTSDRLFSPEYSPWWAMMFVVISAVAACLNRSQSIVMRSLVQSSVVAIAIVVLVRVHGGVLMDDAAGAVTRGLGDVVGARWPAPVTPTSAGGVAFVSTASAALVHELAWTRRYAAVLLLPPALLLLLFAMLSSDAGPPSVVAVALFCVFGALLLRQASIARAERRHGSGPPPDARRRVGLVVAAIVALGGFVPLATGVESSRERWDLRAVREPAPSIDVSISPLSRLSEIADQDRGEPLFVVSPPAFGTRWRFVTLHRYDGLNWMPGEDFRPIGEIVSRSEAAVESYTVAIGSLREPWLPHLGEPTRIDARVRTDALRTGFYLDRLTAGDQTYRVVARDSEVKIDDSDATAEVSNKDRTAMILIESPPDIVTLATSITAGASTDAQRALRLADYFRTTFTEDPDQPVGHTLAQLRETLRTRSGSQEQLVAAYSLLAAAVGLPVRIAVGVEIIDGEGEFGAARGENVAAWPEVAFGQDWAPIGVIPAEANQPGVSPGAVPGRPPEPRPDPITPSVADTERPPEEPTRPEVSRRQLDWWILGPAIAAVAGLLGLLGVLFVVPRRKARRDRARRLAGDPIDQVVGAFRASIDHLVDLGYVPRRSQTDSEVVLGRALNAPGDRDQLHELATLATRATFANQDPPPAVVQHAWELSDEHRRMVDRQVKAVDRAKGRLSPRSLKSRW